MKPRPAQDFLDELAAPARRALIAAGLTSLARLSKRTESHVMQLHGMGPNAMAKLNAALRKAGLQFAPDR
jgi:hypothetical protein